MSVLKYSSGGTRCSALLLLRDLDQTFQSDKHVEEEIEKKNSILNMKNILWSLQLVRFVSLRASPPISIPFHRNTTVYVLAIFAMCFLL